MKLEETTQAVAAARPPPPRAGLPNLGYALEPDDPEAAYRVSRDGAAKARQWGQPFGLRYLVGNATDTAISVGDWDWALGEARDPIWDDAEPAERCRVRRRMGRGP